MFPVCKSTKSKLIGGFATIKNNDPITINPSGIIIPDEIACRCLCCASLFAKGSNTFSNFSIILYSPQNIIYLLKLPTIKCKGCIYDIFWIVFF